MAKRKLKKKETTEEIDQEQEETEEEGEEQEESEEDEQKIEKEVEQAEMKAKRDAELKAAIVEQERGHKALAPIAFLKDLLVNASFRKELAIKSKKKFNAFEAMKVALLFEILDELKKLNKK